MSEVVRRVLMNLRERVGNRRRAARYPVRLSVRVEVLRAAGLADNAPRPVSDGYTRDISMNGAALVMHAIRSGSVYLTGADTLLRFIIELPDRNTLTFDATPARYHQLDLGADGTRPYLVGVRITHIEEAERERLASLLDGLKRK